MKRRDKKRRLEKVVFLLPLALIGGILLYQLVMVTYNQQGTLVVLAESSGIYSQVIYLQVPATVQGTSRTTPFNLTLPQGTYTVTFSPQEWYYTPETKVVELRGGMTAYAVGVYDPIVKTVSVIDGHFNSTTLKVMHGVTPVVLINQMDSVATIQNNATHTLILAPNQNYTRVFDAAGSYDFYLGLGGTSVLTIVVG